MHLKPVDYHLLSMQIMVLKKKNVWAYFFSPKLDILVRNSVWWSWPHRLAATADLTLSNQIAPVSWRQWEIQFFTGAWLGCLGAIQRPTHHLLLPGRWWAGRNSSQPQLEALQPQMMLAVNLGWNAVTKLGEWDQCVNLNILQICLLEVLKFRMRANRLVIAAQMASEVRLCTDQH